MSSVRPAARWAFFLKHILCSWPESSAITASGIAKFSIMSSMTSVGKMGNYVRNILSRNRNVGAEKREDENHKEDCKKECIIFQLWM